MARKELTDNLRLTVRVGIIGGAMLALFDVITTLWRSDLRQFIAGDLLRTAFVPLLLYIALSVVVLAILGTIGYLLWRANGLSTERTTLLGVHAGLFSVFAGSMVLVDLLNVRGELRPLVAFGIVILLSVIVAVGIGYGVVLLVRSRRTRMLGAAVFVVPLLLLAVFAYTDVRRSKQLPADFWRLTHAAKVVTSASTGVKDEGSTRPNVLWIILDTLRADHVSSYGYSRKTTPHLDAVAGEGRRYTNAVSPAPWTLPSHAAMLTGLSVSATGADGTWPWLADSFTTLPEVLRDRGYRTFGFSGNDNFGPLPNLQQGFERFSLFTKSQEQEKNLLLARMLRTFLATIKARSDVLGLGSLYRLLAGGDAAKDYGAAQNTTGAEQAITEAMASAQPFFVMLNFMEPHDPYGDSPEGDRYLGELPDAPSFSEAKVREEFITDDVNAYVAGKQTLSAEDQRLITALYDGDVHYTDGKVGELVEFLREKHILDDTLVIITSDHGENLGDNGLIDHVFDIRRPLTHVPLILRYPEKFPAGSTDDTLVQTIDLFPTVLDVAGITDWDRKGLQGLSLLGDERHPFAVSEGEYTNDTFLRTRYIIPKFPDVDQRRFGGFWKSIQDGTYDFIKESRRELLYNYRTDPGETANLRDDEPRVADRLRADLFTWVRSVVNYWNPFLRQPS